MGKVRNTIRRLRRSQYEVIWYRGVRLDRRTIAALEHAEELLSGKVGRKVTLILTQGSYNTSVGASGGTHAGGGALDVYAPSGIKHSDISWAFRLAGWAWWHRPALPGVWKEHGHGILIGHGKLSPTAKAQVQYYMLGRNGLSNHGPDEDRRLPWAITAFNYPLLPVSTKVVVAQAKSKSPKRRAAVRRVQRALNAKMKAGLKVDGKFGPQTRAAYKRFEHAAGVPRVDGIPGRPGLVPLGAGRFTVTP